MNFRLLTPALLLAAGLAGCGGSDSVPVTEPPPPPPPPPPVAFTDFVKTQFERTADDTNPQEVDDTDFAFNDSDNPDAYDDLLGNP